MRLAHLFCILSFTLVNSIVVFSQDERTLEYLRQEEQRKHSEIMRELDSGVFHLDNQEYDLADQKFRYVLGTIRSVPSDLTFYFGKNSYYLNKFKQSIDWLNKYIQLKGPSGQYYSEAVDFLRKAETAYLKERSKDAKKAEEILSVNYDIDCGPSGKVTCPVCKGEHVIIKKGPLTNEYKTCPYCNEHGILMCEEYNQLLRGQLKPKQ